MSIIDPNDEVMTYFVSIVKQNLLRNAALTTRLTVGALFLMARRMPVVPIMAGSRRSLLMSVTLKWKGLAV